MGQVKTKYYAEKEISFYFIDTKKCNMRKSPDIRITRRLYNDDIDITRIIINENHDSNVPSDTFLSNCSSSKQVKVLGASSSPQNCCTDEIKGNGCDDSGDYVNAKPDSSLTSSSSSLSKSSLSSSPSLSHCSQESNVTSIKDNEICEVHKPLSGLKSRLREHESSNLTWMNGSETSLIENNKNSGNERMRMSVSALTTLAILGLTVPKHNLVMPSHLGSPISTPRELQVNYLEARFHPCHTQGIPWEWMNNERYRLTSFALFPSDSPISAIQLASKGFVYFDSGSDCTIICVFCITRLHIFNNMDYIDAEHRRLGMNCPIVKGTQSSNISIIQQCPNMNIEDIFTLLHASRQIENPIEEPVATPVIPNGDSDNVRSSQPSDESGSSVVVTNTSHLAESDGAAHNSGQSAPSPQMMEDSVSSSGQVESEVTSEIPSDAQLMTSTPGNDAVEDVTNTPESNSQQGHTDDPKCSTENTSDKTPSYEKLGIITARPKHLDYALYVARLASFDEWPRNHHIKPADLAKAGYFFKGNGDCAVCFYCGGGLRNWELEDDVWVEHTRWFPKCAFLLQEVGRDFIDTVQAISGNGVQITHDDVIAKMQSIDAFIPLKFRERVIERDPAVLSVIDTGFDKARLIRLAQEIRETGELLSSENLYKAAKLRNILKQDCSNDSGNDSVSSRRGGDEKRDQEMIETLRTENDELRLQAMCKMCMDMEVAVAFLPCGHLVSCTECSCALVKCPICRNVIKGIVKAYVG